MIALFPASLPIPAVATAIAAARLDETASSRELTTGGWIFMAVSLVFVWGLTIWCFGKVLSRKDS